MCAEIIRKGFPKGDQLGPEETGPCGQWVSVRRGSGAGLSLQERISTPTWPESSARSGPGAPFPRSVGTCFIPKFLRMCWNGFLGGEVEGWALLFKTKLIAHD